jgi:phosphate transport system substrate-binding protein
MKAIIMSGLISLVLISACQSGSKTDPAKETIPEQSLRGEFAISGADALYPLMNVLSSEFMKLHPELNIKVSKGGTGSGLKKLLNKEIDLAMVSRELTSDEESLDLWFFPVTKEGVFPVISHKNPYLNRILEQGIKRNTLKELYLGESGLTWGHILSTDSQEPVVVLTRADASGAAIVWANYLGIHRIELAGLKVEGDDGMILKITDEPYSLGYCNAHYAYNFIDQVKHEGIEVIPLDINNNGKIDSNEKFYENFCLASRAAYLGKFPVHLCREIALVSQGQPTDINIIEFLRWIYGDGQKITQENGYTELRSCVAEDYLYLLNHTIFK